MGKVFCADYKSRLIFLLTILMAGGQYLHAQATSGTILGTVVDPSGAAVAGTTITINDTARSTTIHGSQ
jgi:hypothetical protein